MMETAPPAHSPRHAPAATVPGWKDYGSVESRSKFNIRLYNASLTDYHCQLLQASTRIYDQRCRTCKRRQYGTNTLRLWRLLRNGGLGIALTTCGDILYMSQSMVLGGHPITTFDWESVQNDTFALLGGRHVSQEAP
eukprot:6210115-Pleurochrysis_carterae.AAC.3